jgi:tRNA(His) 5'-end guanylyltransferase
MATKDSLGDRMKSYYEDRFRLQLPRRTNILIRIDGKAFHTYTKGLNRPYDEDLMDDMNETTKFLCENIQGAKMGYVQSDEISILITDYDEVDTQGWFDYNLQKMCSISASLATAKFNQLRQNRRDEYYKNMSIDLMGIIDKRYDPEFSSKPKLAMFDARVFIIPFHEEVVNYFVWRQQDATRNSISMAAQSMFSHKELHKKSTDEMQELMFTMKDVNWNDYPTRFKRGSAVIKEEQVFMKKRPDFIDDGKTHLIEKENLVRRKKWNAVETPIFTKDRDFILSTFYSQKENVE